MSRKLLVISGKLKHGKDTFTKYIIDQCYIEGGHDEIKSTAFSDPIKKVV
jgi:tRNA A37 threonylcarbamoyladenosine biosynthesis protein TsaE